MTTKFLTIKLVKFPNCIVMEFPRKNSVLGQFSVTFPLPNPLQNANFINIVVSASLILRTLSKAVSRTLLRTLLRRVRCCTPPLVCALYSMGNYGKAMRKQQDLGWVGLSNANTMGKKCVKSIAFVGVIAFL